MDQDKLVVLSDFAHHPTAIAGALESLRARWPDRRLIACKIEDHFEPKGKNLIYS